MDNLQEVGFEFGGDEELFVQILVIVRSSLVVVRGFVCDSWAIIQLDGDV